MKVSLGSRVYIITIIHNIFEEKGEIKKNKLSASIGCEEWDPKKLP